ncbi:MAG: hypothetical protein IH971_02190 [Candidatus Marinimicrobia bacterium]|nr:hypothetical protein [Candidatus Neomarinimicrobiota bacterium]
MAAKIQPATVMPVSRSSERQWSVLEQNYVFDLLTPNTLLAKYVGRWPPARRWS